MEAGPSLRVMTSGGEDVVTTRRANADELRLLEPLWKSLQVHHARITPRIGPSPKRDIDESWRRRLVKYERWIREPDTFVVLAERGGRPVGYAFVTVVLGHASWASGDRIAELQTLAVAEEERGSGVGTALMGAVREGMAQLGLSELTVTAARSNRDAHRFYERHGLVPAFEVFYGHPGPPEASAANGEHRTRG